MVKKVKVKPSQVRYDGKFFTITFSEKELKSTFKSLQSKKYKNKPIENKIVNDSRVGTIVIISKGFKFEKLKNDAWKDLSTGLVWYDTETKTYTHYEAVEKFGNQLPTIEEFQTAEKHGFREILPNTKDRWFWSSSLYSYSTFFARVFCGDGGSSYYGVIRYDDYVSVRCVLR